VRRLRFSGPKTSIICSPMTSLKISIKTITYLSDTGCLEIQGASLGEKRPIILALTELYAIEAEIRGSPAEERLAVRKARSVQLMQSLYDWIELQRKTLSKHAEMAKAFDYILNHWNALNEFCRDGQVEIDNNIGENALRSVAVGRKNYLFFGSDKGGESAAIIYSLLVTCKLNEVEPEDWLREVIVKLNDWPSNRVHELLP
ncbi:IS66 family transposase, partial [Escherichia coli]|uniref:IS66 family transposase n=8 Tax=Escherichia coli TaxID=562 RepID=UPI0020189134